ncbi:NAD-dependent epimerase/dehydratase family protein, partial [Neisseria meningitidis]
MRAVPPPHISITGLGYLGLPLAQKFYQHSSRVAAIKRSLTSDDINLPIHLDTFDLGSSDAFQTALWRHHADKPVWFFLLPPSSLTHYADTVKQWAELARACNVQHLIFTSSTSVYGDTARECDETAT